MARLIDICTPKQWKTISTSELTSSGYPVYGANGVIGYYSTYNHEIPTILITCRGATCGRINICAEYSYVTGNAMALDDLTDEVDIRYLFYFLEYRGFDDVITGSAQPQIVRESLKNVNVSYPAISIQRRIAATLDKVSEGIDLCRKTLGDLDALVKSQFVEMFGDPAKNSMGWPMKVLGECLDSIGNGKSFVCESHSREGEFPAVLKLSAATTGTYQPDENKAVMDEDDFVDSAEVHDGDLLFTRKNTPELVGMAAYVFKTPPKLMMPDIIFRLDTDEKHCKKIYLWQLINHTMFRPCIQALANGSAKSMSNISKEKLTKLLIPVPEMGIQEQFIDFFIQADKSKSAIQQQLLGLETLKKSLMQEYFG